MLSSAAFQRQSQRPADITSSAGYEALMGKLRLLKAEREYHEKQVFPTTTKLNNHPGPSLVQSLESMAEAAYARNSRDSKNVQHLLSILQSGTTCTPALSRSSSYASSELCSEVESEMAPAPISLFRHLVPGILYECIQDEWVMAAKWVDELIEENDERDTLSPAGRSRGLEVVLVSRKLL